MRHWLKFFSSSEDRGNAAIKHKRFLKKDEDFEIHKLSFKRLTILIEIKFAIMKIQVQ